jgi:cysteine desulfurase/selenocysteine lyase
MASQYNKRDRSPEKREAALAGVQFPVWNSTYSITTMPTLAEPAMLNTWIRAIPCHGAKEKMGKGLIYFDNAATAWPKPEGVYHFMDQFYRTHGVNPGRSGYELGLEAGSFLVQLRKRLTRFFGGDEDTPERLVFTYNVTDALNLIIPGLLGSGDHVITTNLEHNSVIRPVNHLVRDQGAQATFVPFDSAGFVEPDEIKRAIRPNTKAVIVNHGSNVIGTVQPLREIGRLCREHDLTFVVDVAQTAGVIPIDMQAMNIDVVAFTGHKALMGSMGIGGLCIRKHVAVRQVRSGGTGVRSVHPYHLEEYPWRLEFGTPNMVGVAALWAGQDWLDENGVANIYGHEMKLAGKLVEGLRQIDGVRLYCCDRLENHLSTILMNVEGADPGDVGIMLDVNHSIAVRTGLHCAPLVHAQLGTVETHGGVRFSVGAFNTEEEVVAAIQAVAQISVWARERGTRPGPGLAPHTAIT